MSKLNQFEKESLESIKALNDELKRCHYLLLSNEKEVLDIPAGLDKGTIESRIHEMQELLMAIAKRWNGLEY